VFRAVLFSPEEVTMKFMSACATAATLALAGCSVAPGTPPQVRALANPAERAQRSITNFTPALRCMDDKLFDAGVRDVTLMMEEMRDATQRVPVATRDMMTSAFSEMTRRSRAVRLSLFGSDQNNLAQALQQTRRGNPFGVLPDYALRGSVSQFDEEVQRETRGLNLTMPLFGARVGSEARFSMLGFDAALVRTESFTLVPGVSSRNSTVIVRRDASASDAEARLRSGSAVFAFTAARSEGTAQAARNMVELAAIELVGKLTRLPYWQCLGTRDDDAEVTREVEDWFHALDDDERISFVKERLRERRWYDGALDARRDHEPFLLALGGYRVALGLSARGPLDLEFFRRFVMRTVPMGPLAAPRPRAAATVGGASAGSASGAIGTAPPSPASTALSAPAARQAAAAASTPSLAGAAAGAASTLVAAKEPISLQLKPAAQGVSLEVSATEAGYVYCYAQDPLTLAVRRIYPNRFVRDPRIERGATLALPGRARYMLAQSMDYACLHAKREVYGDLPGVLRWGDFDEVKLQSFEAIRERFAESTGAAIALARTPRPVLVQAAARTQERR
jgi:hypothetical protein